MTLERRLHEFRDFVEAIKEEEPPRLASMLTTADEHHDSIIVVTQRIRCLRQGRFRPRSFTKRELDIALLDESFGNRQLVYAHSKAHGAPSLTTLRNHTVKTKIKPSIGPIIIDDIRTNLVDVFLKAWADIGSGLDSPRLLINIVRDEISLEKLITFNREENKMMGSCYEHSVAEELVMEDQASVEKFIGKLQDGEVHVAREMSVYAIKVLGTRGVFPILVAGTCKASDKKVAASIIRQVRQAIDENSEIQKAFLLNAQVTDGDSVQRAAGYEVFFSERISEDNSAELYPYVRRMKGFNPWTGPGGTILEFDYRHVWKRANSHFYFA